MADSNISRLREADVYASMGMTAAALSLYEAVLNDGGDNVQGEELAVMQARINALRQQLAAEKKVNELFEEIHLGDHEDLEKIKDHGEIAAILGGAQSFLEMGLYDEVIFEYITLMNYDYGLEDIATRIFDGMSDKLTITEILDFIHLAAERIGVTRSQEGRLLYFLGLAAETKGTDSIILRDIYDRAWRLNPNDDDVKKKLAGSGATSTTRYGYLVNESLITVDKIKEAMGKAQRHGVSVERIMIDDFHIPKDAIGKSLSMFYNTKFVEFNHELEIPFTLLANLKRAFLMNEFWVPLGSDLDLNLNVLIDEPRNLNKVDNIKSLLGTDKINLQVAVREDIQEFIKHFYDNMTPDMLGSAAASHVDATQLDYSSMPEFAMPDDSEEHQGDDNDENASHIVKLVDQFIIMAFKRKASDIHVEPSIVTRSTTVRFRLDGVLQDYIKVPNTMARAIVARIKILAMLDIAERRLPQDGKIRFKRKGVPLFELRVATIPTQGGFEDAVMRILASGSSVDIEDLGIRERNLDIIKMAATKPYGLILAVGPTGSGKTTTLHSILRYINTPEVKIWTVEDPVEITQKGLRQVEVRPKIGLDFARVMRAFLRADPDIIMVGEMRDEETAAIGIEASLTGHLVLSTLHTNNAPETITRILDMGLNPLNFADSLLAVLGQRLARRTCKACKAAYHPSQDEFDELVSYYGEKYFPATGISYADDLMFYKSEGCDKCFHSGYKGRVGLHEVMANNADIRNFIKHKGTTEQIRGSAIDCGMTTLQQDGVLKVIEGLTDLKDVRRVCL